LKGDEEMNISDQARDTLKQLLQENDAKNIRVYFMGISWGQPRVGLAQDEPDEKDKVITINEVLVAIDPDIESYTENLTLDFSHEANGLVLLGNESDCC
jgi:HesB-like selenoprotein